MFLEEYLRERGKNMTKKDIEKINNMAPSAQKKNHI